jgi:hypothetical protein
VQVTDDLLRFFAEQSLFYEEVEREKSVVSFSALFKSLEGIKGKKINLAFIHHHIKNTNQFDESVCIHSPSLPSFQYFSFMQKISRSTVEILNCEG